MCVGIDPEGTRQKRQTTQFYEVETEETSITIGDLKPQTPYTVSIVAQTSAGRGTNAATINVETSKFGQGNFRSNDHCFEIVATNSLLKSQSVLRKKSVLTTLSFFVKGESPSTTATATTIAIAVSTTTTTTVQATQSAAVTTTAQSSTAASIAKNAVSDGGGLAGVIAGSVIGGILIILLITIACYCFCKRKRQQANASKHGIYCKYDICCLFPADQNDP